MYLTFSEYQNMGGTLDETAFNDLEFEAEAIVDWYTFNRLQNNSTYPEKLKQCMYKLIRMTEERQQTMSPGETMDADGNVTSAIASRSNDGVSISYNIVSAGELFDKLKIEMGDVVRKYLNGVVNELGRKVLYRGFYPGE